jgi:3,5-epimerase/4-reductase
VTTAWLRGAAAAHSRLCFLVYGHRGWIGQQVTALLDQVGIVWRGGQARPADDDDAAVARELDETAPTHVLSAIGRTHTPETNSIDCLEGGDHAVLKANLHSNLYAPVLLALLCRERGIWFGQIGTGCLWTYETEDWWAEAERGPGRGEAERPNFFGSAYSIVKGVTDRIMHHIDGALNVRIRMPVTDRDEPRNFVSKLVRYRRVIDAPNSVSVLPELLPILVDLALRGCTGTINLVNRGYISHRQVLEIWRESVDPAHPIDIMTVAEQRSYVVAERSNTRLDTSLLESMYEISTAEAGVRRCIQAIAAARRAAGPGADSPLAQGRPATISDAGSEAAKTDNGERRAEQ